MGVSLGRPVRPQRNTILITTYGTAVVIAVACLLPLWVSTRASNSFVLYSTSGCGLAWSASRGHPESITGRHTYEAALLGIV